MQPIEVSVEVIADWLSLERDEDLRNSLSRVLTWATDEFDREDPLPAALSQRYAFREPVPRHLIEDFVGLVSFIPGPEWKPAPSLIVFASTPDQFSARLSLAHDYCIRHQTRSVLILADYFDNQVFRRPANTFQSLNEREGVRLAICLYSAFGLALIPLLGQTNDDGERSTH